MLDDGSCHAKAQYTCTSRAFVRHQLLNRAHHLIGVSIPFEPRPLNKDLPIRLRGVKSYTGCADRSVFWPR